MGGLLSCRYIAMPKDTSLSTRVERKERYWEWNSTPDKQTLRFDDVYVRPLPMSKAARVTADFTPMHLCAGPAISIAQDYWHYIAWVSDC